MKKIWCLSWNFVNFKAIIRGTYWFDFNYPKQEFSVRKLEEVYTCIWDKKKNPNVLSENFFFYKWLSKSYFNVCPKMQT